MWLKIKKMVHKQTIKPTDYEFDVFISYCRLKQWPLWLQKYFLPVFEHWLSSELGRDARVFVDLEMKSGVSWPTTVGQKLARSAVLVPLWTRNYFASEWCTEEFSHMLMREENCNYRTNERPDGLIVPAIIHDGSDFPWEIGHINHVDLCACSNIIMVPDGKTAEMLSERLRDWMPSVRCAIENAPPYDPNWDQMSATKFFTKYQKTPPRQLTVPRF
jgi:hypothetical protein